MGREMLGTMRRVARASLALCSLLAMAAPSCLPGVVVQAATGQAGADAIACKLVAGQVLTFRIAARHLPPMCGMACLTMACSQRGHGRV